MSRIVGLRARDGPFTATFTTMQPLYDYISVSLDPFLPLPGNVSALWPHSVIQAYNITCTSYNLAIKLLDQDDCSSLQLSMLAHRLKEDIFPIFAALSGEVDDEEWGKGCALLLGAAIVRLLAAAENLKDSECV